MNKPKLISRFTLILALFLANIASAQLWEIKKRIEPKYPVQAAKNNVEGCVVVQFFINNEGRTTHVELIQSSVQDVFDTAAYNAVSQWQYSATEKNVNSEPQRQVLQLDFSLSEHSLVSEQCKAELTSEAGDIDTFKENRLLTPIDGTSQSTFKHSMALTSAVLSNAELKYFMMSISELMKSQMKGMSLSQALNGLSYFQILSMTNLSLGGEQQIEKKWQARIDRKLSKIPLVNTQTFHQLWEMGDMSISMETELYKEISYQLLKAEILVRSDGTARLVGTCRKVNDDMVAAINASIIDWQLTSKSKVPRAVRYIYELPAPIEAGAYYQCDEDWYPNHKSTIPSMSVDH